MKEFDVGKLYVVMWYSRTKRKGSRKDILGRSSYCVGEGVVWPPHSREFTSLARLGLVWRCWENNRPYSGYREQIISTLWLGVQWEIGTGGGRGHRGLQST